MKQSLIILFFFVALQARAANNVFNNGSGDGLWGTETNWSLGTIPGSGDNAVVNNGNVVTVAAHAPSVNVVTVGNGAVSNTTLFIEAHLTANQFQVAWSANAIGAVHQSNGTVTVNSSFKITSSAVGSDIGTYTLYGGSLDFSGVTLDVGTQGRGFFTIEGSSPASISGKHMNLGGNATLTLNLDTVGITPVTLTGTLTVDAGSKLVVNGTDYEALDGYFPLVLAASQAGSFDPTNVTLTGFVGREPALVSHTDGLWLRLLAPPVTSDHFYSLVPESTVAPDYANTQFSATRSLDPSGSAWSLTLNEAHVMNTRLTQDVLDGGLGQTNRSWELRVAQNGSLYSLRTPALGETVPPSWRSDRDSSPWNDEVWQGVSVSDLNNPPSSPYFMHQSGIYWKKDPTMKKPYYSPQVGAELDLANRSFTTINWTPQAHVSIYADASTNNDWKSYQLVYTRYRDLGQGLIEVTLGNYNYGPDLITWMNMPWGGVRRTSTEYAFLSGTNGTSWTPPVTGGFGSTSPTNYNDTGGWAAFSGTSDGSTPSLGIVFGKDAATLPTNSAGNSWYRWGYAGGSFQTNETNWRNYFVSSNVRRYNLHQGNGIWSRSYFVLGDDLTDLSDRIAARSLVDVELLEFNYLENTTPLVGYRFTGSGTDFRVTQDSSSPDFFLYAYPVNRSFPLFEIIENDFSRYLTWNPYANGIIKPYDGTLAGIRLLGYAMPDADVNGGGTSYTYDQLTNILASVPANYMADGENLSVRLISCMQDWRLQYFGTVDNTGPRANNADFDGDGVANLMEYALGGVPTNESDPGILPGSRLVYEPGFQGLEYNYLRRRDAVERRLTYRVETSSNLQSVVWTTNGTFETGKAILDSEFECVTNRTVPADVMSIRLKIEIEE